MGFVPLVMLDNSTAKEYYLNKVYPIFRELIERSIFANYSKHYIDKTLMQIVNELSTFVKKNDKLLTKHEKNYIKGLDNLTKQFKRYAREKSSATYPVAISKLTTDYLENFISELSKSKSIRSEIVFFIDPLYQALYNITYEKALTYNGLKYNELVSQEALSINAEELISLNVDREEKSKKRKGKFFFNWF